MSNYFNSFFTKKQETKSFYLENPSNYVPKNNKQTDKNPMSESKIEEFIKYISDDANDCSQICNVDTSLKKDIKSDLDLKKPNILHKSLVYEKKVDTELSKKYFNIFDNVDMNYLGKDDDLSKSLNYKRKSDNSKKFSLLDIDIDYLGK